MEFFQFFLAICGEDEVIWVKSWFTGKSENLSCFWIESYDGAALDPRLFEHFAGFCLNVLSDAALISQCFVLRKKRFTELLQLNRKGKLDGFSGNGVAASGEFPQGIAPLVDLKSFFTIKTSKLLFVVFLDPGFAVEVINCVSFFF